MIKIKEKQRLNISELIRWAWDNPRLAKNKTFVGEYKYNCLDFEVSFNSFGNINLENCRGDCPCEEVMFVVEYEFDVDIDTPLDRLMIVKDNYETSVHSDVSIQEIIETDNVLACHYIKTDGSTDLLYTKQGGVL